MDLSEYVVGVARCLNKMASAPVATVRLSARAVNHLQVVVSDSDVHLALLVTLQSICSQDDALALFRGIDILTVRSTARLLAEATSRVRLSLPDRNSSSFLRDLPTDPTHQAWLNHAFLFFLTTMINLASNAAPPLERRRRIVVVKQGRDKDSSNSKPN